MTNKKPAPLNQGEREYKGSHSYINKNEYNKWGKYMAKKYYKENKEHKSECRSRQAEHYRAHKDHYHAMIAQASWDRKYGSKHFVLDDGADLKQTYLLLLNNDSFGGFIHRKNNLALSFYILEGEKKNYYLLVNGNLRNRTAEVYEYDLITYSDYFPGERREIKDKEELITLLKLHAYINKKRRDEQ